MKLLILLAILVEGFFTMKFALAFITFQFIFSNFTFSQRAQIWLKSDSVIRTEIHSVADHLIITQSGNFKTDDIKFIEFDGNNKAKANVYGALKESNVSHFFSPKFKAKVKTKSGTTMKGYIYRVENDVLVLQYQKKVKQVSIPDIDDITIYQNKSGKFWVGFGIGVAIQMVLGAAIMSAGGFWDDPGILAFALLFSNNFIGLTSGMIIGGASVAGKSDMIKLSATDVGLVTIERTLSKYQTLRNERQ